MAITVVGSLALDSIKSEAGSVERAVGGSAVHFSNAASLTTQVNVVGVVGEDFPFDSIEYLKERNVDFSGVEVVAGGKTFFWKGRYEGDMNQAISEATDLNVFENFQPKLSDSYKAANFLFLANIHPLLQKHVLSEASSDCVKVLDSMNYWIENTPEELNQVISMVDVVFLNDEEARTVAQEKNLIAAGRKILQMGPKYIIIKKGEHGSLAMHDDWIISFPAVPLDSIVDPTGAGDSFAGAMVGYLDAAGDMGSETWKAALLYATCVASFNVQDFSVQGIQKVTGQKIKDRFEGYKKMFVLEGDLDVAQYVTL